MKIVMQSLKAYIIFTVLLGLAYPLAITLIAQVAMPEKANGSLILRDNRVIGSRLIGQNFSQPGYFQARMSANNYDGSSSGATNLGPSSRKLMDATAQKIAQIRRENGLSPATPLPADMALSSASGLDPHITPANALLQVPRVAKLRGVSESELKKMVADATDADFLGIWGRPGVNVLALNIALDNLEAEGTGSR